MPKVLILLAFNIYKYIFSPVDATSLLLRIVNESLRKSHKKHPQWRLAMHRCGSLVSMIISERIRNQDIICDSNSSEMIPNYS